MVISPGDVALKLKENIIKAEEDWSTPELNIQGDRKSFFLPDTVPTDLGWGRR